jgi:hypothetical protein
MVGRRPPIAEVERALRKTAGNINAAAALLGVHKDTVRAALIAANAQDLPKQVAQEVKSKFRINVGA